MTDFKAELLALMSLANEFLVEMGQDADLMTAQDRRTRKGVELIEEAAHCLYAACVNMDVIRVKGHLREGAGD